MKTVLVIDDEDTLRMLLCREIKTAGYNVIESDNGEDALEMIKQQKPDLIISDVMMTNMNGFMLRQAITDDPEIANIPFIMMTGMAMNAGAWEADPDVDYIKKPFIIPDVIALINKRLKEK